MWPFMLTILNLDRGIRNKLSNVLLGGLISSQIRVNGKKVYTFTFMNFIVTCLPIVQKNRAPKLNIYLEHLVEQLSDPFRVGITVQDSFCPVDSVKCTSTSLKSAQCHWERLPTI